MWEALQRGLVVWEALQGKPPPRCRHCTIRGHLQAQAVQGVAIGSILPARVRAKGYEPCVGYSSQYSEAFTAQVRACSPSEWTTSPPSVLPPHRSTLRHFLHR